MLMNRIKFLLLFPLLSLLSLNIFCAIKRGTDFEADINEKYKKIIDTRTKEIDALIEYAIDYTREDATVNDKNEARKKLLQQAADLKDNMLADEILNKKKEIADEQERVQREEMLKERIAEIEARATSSLGVEPQKNETYDLATSVIASLKKGVQIPAIVNQIQAKGDDYLISSNTVDAEMIQLVKDLSAIDMQPQLVAIMGEFVRRIITDIGQKTNNALTRDSLLFIGMINGIQENQKPLSDSSKEDLKKSFKSFFTNLNEKVTNKSLLPNLKIVKDQIISNLQFSEVLEKIDTALSKQRRDWIRKFQPISVVKPAVSLARGQHDQGSLLEQIRKGAVLKRASSSQTSSSSQTAGAYKPFEDKNVKNIIEKEKEKQKEEGSLPIEDTRDPSEWD